VLLVAALVLLPLEDDVDEDDENIVDEVDEAADEVGDVCADYELDDVEEVVGEEVGGLVDFAAVDDGFADVLGAAASWFVVGAAR
jgi:hypothetical protein